MKRRSKRLPLSAPCVGELWWVKGTCVLVLELSKAPQTHFPSSEREWWVDVLGSTGRVRVKWGEYSSYTNWKRVADA